MKIGDIYISGGKVITGFIAITREGGSIWGDSPLFIHNFLFQLIVSQTNYTPTMIYFERDIYILVHKFRPHREVVFNFESSSSRVCSSKKSEYRVEQRVEIALVDSVILDVLISDIIPSRQDWILKQFNVCPSIVFIFSMDGC